MKKSRLAATIASLGLCLAPVSGALAKTGTGERHPLRVVTIGDSWSDAGTFGKIFGTLPGEAWPQILARHFGDHSSAYLMVPPPPAQPGEAPITAPTVLGGYDYAEGGARVGIHHGQGNEDAIPRSMWRQLDMHLAREGHFTKDDLVIVWGGGNDVVRPYGEGPDEKAFLSGANLTPDQIDAARANVDAAVQAEIDLLKKALASGAQRIVVLDLIDLSLTDFTPGLERPGLAFAGELSRRYNAALAKSLPHDKRILFVPISRTFDAIARNPASQGYKVIDGDACRDQSYSCGPEAYVTPDADRTYAFAGWGHFTQKTREVIADNVLEAMLAKWPDLHGKLTP